MARVDYDKQSAVYDAGRSFDPDDYAAWRVALARRIEPGAVVLDLGSGTGRWSGVLADWFGCRVVGVEPSGGMREHALAKGAARGVSYVGGRAEAIPARDEVFDAAWLAHVVHHFDDLGTAAHELRRVLRAGSPLLVRQAFADRLEGITLFRFFPGAGEIARTFPRAAEVMAVLTDAGFQELTLERYSQRTAPSLEAMIPRIELRADTTLELLDDGGFAAGLRALREAARVEDGPVIDALDLLVAR